MGTSPSPRAQRAFEAMGDTTSWPTPNALHEQSDMGQLRLVALTATLGLASASWVIAVRQMNGMDMGAATQLGSFASFIAFWVAMMAAMMLPGATPAVVRRTLDSRRLRTVPLFVGGYLAVWTLFGVGVFVLYHPHGALVAGALTIAAGIYELTPLKQQFRRICRERACSAFEFGLCCVGSSIGLMPRAGRDERRLDGGHRRHRSRAEGVRRQSRGRCAARSRDHCIRGPDHGRPLVAARANPTDVRGASVSRQSGKRCQN